MADYENDNGRYAGMYCDLIIDVRHFNQFLFGLCR